MALARVLCSGAEQFRKVEAELREHQDRDQDGAGHQQNGLDDLDPRRALHAAHGDVEDHQQADPDDRQCLERFRLHVEEQGDERAGTDHLREQVEDRDDHRGRCGRGAYGALPHAVGELVGHRVSAGVAQQLGDEQQGDQPSDEEADRVEESVVAVERDEARDAEEGRSRHVVARDGESVLEAAEGAATCVEVGGAGAVSACPEGDRDREQDDGDEERGGEGLGTHRFPPLKRASSSRASGSTARFMYRA